MVFFESYVPDVVIGIFYSPVISDYFFESFSAQGSCGGKVVGFFCGSFVDSIVFGWFGCVFGFDNPGKFDYDFDCFSPVYVCYEP